MLKRACQTSLVVLVEDPKMTDQLAELLLQTQGGLAQGLSKGTDFPKGTFLLTSNSPKTEQYKI